MNEITTRVAADLIKIANGLLQGTIHVTNYGTCLRYWPYGTQTRKGVSIEFLEVKESK